jgi:hypothetical protein
MLSCATIIHTSEPNKQMLHLPSNIYTDILIGAISGAASMTMYAPFSYFQNRTIQQLPIAWQKPHYWFRGYPTLAFNSAPVIAIQTTSYHYLTHKMKLHPDIEPSNTDTIFAATVAGGLSGPVNNTAQLIALHQHNTGLSIIETVNKFPHSYKSLHRATVPAICRGMLFANAYINCLPSIKNYIHRHCNNDSIALATSALFSSIFTTITTQPIQVIITKLHADIEKKHYNGMIQAGKKIIATEGLRALYKGAYYRTLGNTLALPVLNYVQQTLNALK